MAKYRDQLPQLQADVFLADGGIETTLIFDDGLDLPDFAAFHLLAEPDGEAALRRYFEPYGEIAARDRVGIVLETPTWRANPDWATKLGYSAEELADVNRRSVALVEQIRDRHETDDAPIVISGCLGPRGDGYRPGATMTADEAREYHSAQIVTFRDTEADLVTGHHHELRRGGDRHRGGGQGRRNAGRDLVHRRDRRHACRPARGSARRSRRSTRPPTGTRRTTWSTAPTPATSKRC